MVEVTGLRAVCILSIQMVTGMSDAMKSRSSAIKRIMSEVRELQNDDTPDFSAAPTEDNLFEWHFTLRGPRDTVFEKGLYHGKLTLPSEYPFKAPHVIFLTPNGRWSVDTKVCVTFTGFHEESWQPAWGIRTALLGIQALMTSKEDEAGYGAASMNDEGRKLLAEKSWTWTCPLCQKSNAELLPEEPSRAPNTAPPTALPASVVSERIEEPATSPSHSIPPVREEPFSKESMPASNPQASTPSIAPSAMEEATPSMAELLHARAESYRRTISMIDSLMGLICVMLFLLVLKNM